MNEINEILSLKMCVERVASVYMGKNLLYVLDERRCINAGIELQSMKR